MVALFFDPTIHYCVVHMISFVFTVAVISTGIYKVKKNEDA